MKRTSAYIVAVLLLFSMLSATLYVSRAAVDFKYGDVNLDEAINVKDILLVRKFVAGWNVEIHKNAADVNCDGHINLKDVLLLRKFIAGLITELGAAASTTNAQMGKSAGFVFSQTGVKAYAADGKEISSDFIGGTVVTITRPGEYCFSGECSNGRIVVDIDKTLYPDDGKKTNDVTLRLEGLTLRCEDNSVVYVASIHSECVIVAAVNTVNTLSDGKQYTNPDDGSGAVYSKDDLKIKGKGVLKINGSCSDGIVCKDDLKIWNSTLAVTAVDDGIVGRDCVKIGDPDDTDYSNLKITVTASGDGIKSTNDTDSDKGFVRINGGTIEITAAKDGIQAQTNADVNGSVLNIISGGGYTKSVASSDSAKGVKAGAILTVSDGELTIDSADDALHSNDVVNITGGILNLSTADDGVHADNILTITGGTLNVQNSYEGLEGTVVNISGGTVTVSARDDGINACGGNGGGGWWPRVTTTKSGGAGLSPSINISGGYIDVTVPAGDTDGLDSNGDVNISGGTLFVKSSAGGGMSGTIDADGTLTVNGGTIIACGGIEKTPSTASVNYSARMNASMTAGAYSIKDSSGNILASFKLIMTYSALLFSSDSIVSSGSYTLYRDSSSVASWTQTSKLVVVGGAATTTTRRRF